MITDEPLTASGAVRRCAVGLPCLRHKSKGEDKSRGEGVEVRVPCAQVRDTHVVADIGGEPERLPGGVRRLGDARLDLIKPHRLAWLWA